MSSAVNALFYMRRQAGLTQAQVAERLHTKQSAVARLEGDFDGSISLRRYIDFALACGMVPHNITFAPLDSVINYTIAQPEIPYKQINHVEWLKANSQPTSSSAENGDQAENASEALSKTLQPQSGAVSSTEGYAKSVLTDSNNVTSSTTTHHQEYFQPYTIPPLQLPPDGGRTSTALEFQEKISNLAPSKVS